MVTNGVADWNENFLPVLLKDAVFQK